MKAELLGGPLDGYAKKRSNGQLFMTFVHDGAAGLYRRVGERSDSFTYLFCGHTHATCTNCGGMQEKRGGPECILCGAPLRFS